MAKARIVIGPKGDLNIFVDEGTLESGRESINALVDALRASSVTFKSVGVVEAHRHTLDAQENKHTHTA